MNEAQLISIGFVILIFASTLFLVSYAFWKYIETKRWQRRFQEEEARKKEKLRREVPDLYKQLYGDEEN